MLVVQIVEIIWTKATRGAPRANERAAVPRAFPVHGDRATYLRQHYRMIESEDFAPTLLTEESSETVPSQQRSLRIRKTSDSKLSLGLVWSPIEGQPSRHPKPEAIELSAGQFARLIINGRHTSYSGQHYSEVIYNVAFVETPQPHVFLREPDHEFSLAANLF